MKDLNYPHWIKSFLSKDDIQSIASTVKTAEIKTSGEIVPIIVRRSSAIGHLPILITSLMLILFFLVDGFNYIDYQFQIHFSNILASVGAYLTLIIVTVLFYFISLKISEVDCVQRFFISNSEKSAQVHERALLEFYLNHVTKTEFNTGILIFISLMERQAIVIGDESISQKIPEGTWQNIVNIITSSIGENKTTEGLKIAIKKCGEILTQHFPAAPKNPDELENHLIIKE